MDEFNQELTPSAETRVTGRLLAQRAGLKLKSPLYRRTGNWYHLPQNFPTALFDDAGYMLFREKDEFDKFVDNDSKVYAYPEKNQLSVMGGISLRQGYTRISHILLAEEIREPKRFWEGARTTIVINAYERDQSARRACIEHWGSRCSTCQMSFGERYGALASGFIHVHHLFPLKDIKKSYELNPIDDLRPVCPNCHAVMHMQDPPISIESLRKTISASNSTLAPRSPEL